MSNLLVLTLIVMREGKGARYAHLSDPPSICYTIVIKIVFRRREGFMMGRISSAMQANWSIYTLSQM